MRRSIALLVIMTSVVGPLTSAAAQNDASNRAPIDAPATTVTVVMTEIEPFVENRDGRPSGFYAEIWQVVAADLGVRSEVVWVDRFSELLTAIDDGRAAVAVAPLTATRDREPTYDFTSAVVVSGPQLAYHDRVSESTGLLRALFSPAVRQILLISLAGLLILAHLIWIAERHRDDDEGTDFDDRYLHGIWDGLWWATVTVTTVGYGDKAPSSGRGRVIALMAMGLSLFLVGAFVSQVTAALQESRQAAPLTTLAEIADERVGVVEGSTFARYLELEEITIAPFADQAAVFDAADAGEIDFVVANPYALSTLGREHGLVAVGDVFYTEFESFGLAQGSPWREPINQVIAELQAAGEIEDIVERWVPELAG